MISIIIFGIELSLLILKKSQIQSSYLFYNDVGINLLRYVIVEHLKTCNLSGLIKIFRNKIQKIHVITAVYPYYYY